MPGARYSLFFHDKNPSAFKKSLDPPTNMKKKIKSKTEFKKTIFHLQKYCT